MPMPSKKLRVAIVGAGPAGLVAAHTLLRTGKFEVKIFEQSSSIGGLWSQEGLIDPNMTTNLNRFTVSFSGLSWESVDIDSTEVPLYPKAWQVNRYLEEYHRRYIPEDTVQLNVSVIRAERVDLENQKDMTGWKITTASTGDKPKTEQHVVDFLVAASGQFSRPKSFDQEDFLSFDPCQIPIVHSTEYRQLSDILPASPDPRFSQGKIVVVGGSHSGSEVVDKIALDLYSRFDVKEPLPYEIVHITNRNLFALSPLVPSEHIEGHHSFESADFGPYNLSSRPAGPDSPISFTFAHFNTAKQQNLIKALRRLVGEDCTDATESNISNSEDTDIQSLPVSVVLSEIYAQMKRAGLIKQVQGTLTNLGFSPLSKSYHAGVTTRDTKIEIENVVGVVRASGFDPTSSLSFLEDDVRSLIECDEQCTPYPVILDTSYMSQNSKITNLAILGFAEQYWTIMEMQARAIAHRWCEGRVYPSRHEQEAIATFTREIRELWKAGKKAELPPYAFSDYVGIVEQAARELNLMRNDREWLNTEGPICAARYLDYNASDEEKNEALITMTRFQDGVYRNREVALSLITRATFYALLGPWRLHDSEEASPGIIFYPRTFKGDGMDFEYLCIETTGSGSTQKIYRHPANTTHITIWSAGDKHPYNAEHHLATLSFAESLSDSCPKGAIYARYQWVDDPDAEEVTYAFGFESVRITGFRVEAKAKPTQIWVAASAA